MHFAVVGLGTFGRALALALSRLGAEVTAVDSDRAHVEALKDEVRTAIRMDGRDREGLAEQGIHETDCAVVCMGEDFEAAEICAVHLTELGCPRVLVRGTTRERIDILTALGPEVISPGLDAGREWAIRLLAPGLVDYAVLKGPHDLAVVAIPERLDGSTVEGLKLGRHHVSIAAHRRGDTLFPHPGPEQDLRTGDHLLLLGAEKDLLRTAVALE